MGELGFEFGKVDVGGFEFERTMFGDLEIGRLEVGFVLPTAAEAPMALPDRVGFILEN